jgi:hypothetical protein
LNFPVGDILGKGSIPIDFVSMAQDLSSKAFNGYLILSVKGNFVEEGIIFFKSGLIIGCIVECLAVERTLKGNDALEFFFNQTKGKGFFHLVELTRSQVDLITAFDEKLLVNKIDLKELPKSIPSVFSVKFEKLLDSKSPLEVYGLSELK